jgi:hypothetical protein
MREIRIGFLGENCLLRKKRRRSSRVHRLTAPILGATAAVLILLAPLGHGLPIVVVHLVKGRTERDLQRTDPFLGARKRTIYRQAHSKYHGYCNNDRK